VYREREGKKRRREKERERSKRERKRRKTQTRDTRRTQTIKCGENHNFAVLIGHLITKLNQIRIELSLVDTDHLSVCATHKLHSSEP
jgi:hypothetical protein